MKHNLDQPAVSPAFEKLPDSETKRKQVRESSTVSAIKPAKSSDPAIPFAVAHRELRQRVLDAISSPSSKCNYRLALDKLFAFADGRPLTRGLFLDFRESMKSISPSTANVRLIGVRKLVAEAQRSGVLSPDEADDLAGVLKMRPKVTHLTTRLSDDQVNQMLIVPDRTTLSGKRDYCILALLLGCSLRRGDLADILVDHLQEHDGRCFLRIPATHGGTPRIAPVAVWVKDAIQDWKSTSQITEGRLLRVVSSKGDVLEEGLSQQSAWEIVLGAAVEVGIDSFDAVDPRWFRVKRSSEARFNEVQRLLGPVHAPEAAQWASGGASVGLLGKLLDGAIHKLARKYDDLAAEEERGLGVSVSPKEPAR